MSSVIYNNLYPIVKKNLSADKKSAEKELKRIILRFVDRNNESLTKSGPVDRIPFLDKDSDDFMKIIGLDNAMIKKAIKDSDYINSSWKVVARGFYTAASLTISYFLETKNYDMAKLVASYLSLSMYPLVHFKYWKHGVNENIMNYTITNVSNKYKFKQLGTVYNTMCEMADNCLELHTKRLTPQEGKPILDKIYVDFINDMHSRLNDKFKNINNEYINNHANGNYLNIDSDSDDEDNYYEADNSSYAIERILNNTLTKLVVQGVNMRLVTYAAKACQVSVNELRTQLVYLVTNERRDDIKIILESILQLYLFDTQHSTKDIHSSQFIGFCLDVYKRSNSTDKNVLTIKKVLDRWIVDIDLYKKTQRAATINNFRRAMYVFFVLNIQFYN